MPADIIHFKCTFEPCPENGKIVGLSEDIVKQYKTLHCPMCQRVLQRGGRIIRSGASKLEAFLKFGRGSRAGAFYQNDYLQTQVQNKGKRKYSESTGDELFHPTGMDVEPKGQQKDAFPGLLKEGCCLALSAVWLQYEGKFKAFDRYVRDSTENSGLGKIKGIQLRYQYQCDGKHEKFILDSIFGQMDEFEMKNKTTAKHDKKTGQQLNTTNSVVEMTRFCMKKGHYLIGMWGDGGHAVAIVNHGKACSFFDSNSGQFDFPTMDNLAQFLRMYMVHFYPNMSGDWLALRVYHKGYKQQGNQVSLRI